MNNDNTYEILKSVFRAGNSLAVYNQPSNEYEVFNLVYNPTESAFNVTLQGGGTSDDFVLFAESLIEGNNISFDINTTAHTVTISVTGLTETQTVTYAELQALVTASSLEVGKRYLITDFAQSYNIFDGSTKNIEEEQIGAAEPIIVTASKVNELHKVAISTVYPQDIIHYSLDILDIRDIGFGNGVDTVNANFKGQIYYRKDTIQNVETHYDFRNIKFRRWAVDAVAFDNGTAYAAKAVCKSGVDGKIYKCITATTGEGDPTVNTADWALWLDITADALVSWTADKTLFNIGNITTNNLIINNTTAGVDYADYYTFGNYYNWVKNVSIGMIDLEYAIGTYNYATQLNNTVFKTINNSHTCYSNKIGNNFWNNTIGNEFYYNIIGNYFQNNAIGYEFYSNTIRNNFQNNTTENRFYSNIIGNDFTDNTIRNKFNANIIGNDFYSNIIGSNFQDNTIGNYFTNTIGNYFSYNTIGNYLNKTIFGDNCKHNTIANKINGTNKIITFGNGITMCTIQDFAFGVLAANLDLSTATHIRGLYNTTIYRDAIDGVKLSYMTGGELTVASVTA